MLFSMKINISSFPTHSFNNLDLLIHFLNAYIDFLKGKSTVKDGRKIQR